MTPEELAEIQGRVIKAAGEIESRLATSLDKVIEGINEKSTAAADELRSTVKTALEAMPNLIKENVEGSLQANLKDIVEKVSSQFEEKVKAKLAGGGNSGAPGGGLSLNQLLEQSDKIIGVINAFRAPTTEQAMMGQMNFVMKWHSLLSKLEKGGGSGDEFTKAIAATFITEKE